MHSASSPTRAGAKEKWPQECAKGAIGFGEACADEGAKQGGKWTKRINRQTDKRRYRARRPAYSGL